MTRNQPRISGSWATETKPRISGAACSYRARSLGILEVTSKDLQKPAEDWLKLGLATVAGQKQLLEGWLAPDFGVLKPEPETDGNKPKPKQRVSTTQGSWQHITCQRHHILELLGTEFWELSFLRMGRLSSAKQHYEIWGSSTLSSMPGSPPLPLGWETNNTYLQFFLWGK